jgi:hypothetical protein
MPTQNLLLITIITAALCVVPIVVNADKLEGFDDTMQVLDEAADLERAAAYVKVPDADDDDEPASADQAAAESEITDPADFDDDFEHDVEFEEELMQDEDDFEDGDDVDDDRVGAAP